MQSFFCKGCKGFFCKGSKGFFAKVAKVFANAATFFCKCCNLLHCKVSCKYGNLLQGFQPFFANGSLRMWQKSLSCMQRLQSFFCVAKLQNPKKIMTTQVFKGLCLPLSSRSKSGYKYVIHDPRKAAAKKPWSATHKGFRSRGFGTARECAAHLATTKGWYATERPIQKPKGPRLPATVPTVPTPAATVPVPTVPTPAATVPMPTVPTAPTSTAPTPTAPTAPLDAWMTKPGVKFKTDACDLFGQRIMMYHDNVEKAAVIKSWTPSATAAFGVVFDDMPEKVFREDLQRRGRSDWRIIHWEADEWQTQDLRPMCPGCGHPMLEGRAAWTRCTPCGQMEPGCASTELLSRIRTGDPYRRKA